MILSLNHVALFVKDVEVSAKFYEETMGLKKIPRPAFDFPGAWFEIGKDQELHLIGGRKQTESHFTAPRGNHFAIRISSYKEAETMLRSKGADFLAPAKRPDGAIQIFLKDPDGYFIELVEFSC